jgi:hypothetical protein
MSKRAKWYKAGDKETMDNIKAIKNDVTGELALVGHYGEIWQVSPSTFAAVITSARVAKRYLPESRHPINPGDETRITFPASELATWIERLKITQNRNGMIRMADWFGNENE